MSAAVEEASVDGIYAHVEGRGLVPAVKRLGDMKPVLGPRCCEPSGRR